MNLTQHYFCFNSLGISGDIIIVMPLGHDNCRVKKRYIVTWMCFEIHRSMGKIGHSQGARSRPAQFGKCLEMMCVLNWH